MSITETPTAAQLRSVVDCPVILPGDKGYDVARHVWNADIDRHPAAIVRCRDAQDVSRALTWCLDHDLEVTVRGGGHNLAGTSVDDGAVLLDTGGMRDVLFDREAGTVRVGAGCRLGNLDRACADEGVVVPAGTVSHTGVAGLTLGGGNGYLSRMYGLTVDHLLSVELVLADGRIITASADEHPDLFWALRGAGHNFGVAISFTFRYLPFTRLANVRQAFFATDDRREVLRFFRDWAYDAPDNVVTYARTVEVPEYWTPVPTAHRGTQIVSVATVQWGDDEPEVTQPMFAQATPIWETSYTVPHMELQRACDDDFRYGIRRYWRNGNLRDFPDEAIDTVLHWSDRYPGRPLQAGSTIAPHFACPFQLFPRGGQAAKVDPWDTAVGDRVEARWMSSAGAEWEFPSEAPELIEWTRAFDADMDRFKAGSYVNFTTEIVNAMEARDIYGEKYDRLVKVKRAYDPANVFRRGLVDLSGGTDA
ncbi:FAD-binding oxidoreductase [Streptosporangium sp. NPDC051023]|uniref:FAD-binding oxidoreductase n=1 Tax=Streptosporangium sp. NPDC051023 TaxID=3155410 RepID=UPI00344CE937